MAVFGKDRLAGIDLLDPRTHAESELRDIWTYLRHNEPIIWHPFKDTGFWVVSQYEDVRRILSDKECFSSHNGNSLDSLLAGGDPAAGKMLAISDGARHLAIRAQLMKCLQPSVMARCRARVERSVQRRLERVLDRDCDLSGDFAKYVPLDTICDLMGINAEAHREQLYSFSSMALSTPDQSTPAAAALIARNEMLMLFSELVEAKRQHLSDDLISDLIRMEIGNCDLGFEEILFNCYNLFLGGNEEPRFALLDMLTALHAHPGEWARLCRGEVAVADALEEILRWSTPVLHLARSVVKAIEINGVVMQAGQIVSLWNRSANFDETVFVDPHTLILDRKAKSHLSFGYGKHFCVGAALARLELAVTAEALIRNVAVIELSGPARPVYSNFIAGLAVLPGRLVSRTGSDRAAGAARRPAPDSLPEVRIDFLAPQASALPFAVPVNKNFTPLPWLQENKPALEHILRQHGAIVLRDFGITSVSAFSQVAEILISALQEYVQRSTPRTRLGGKIYTATDYPSDRHIQLHNENAYSHCWPSKIIFYSAIVAAQGGETVVADSRRVYQGIDPAIREQFENKGVMYVRNYTPGVDLSWQDVFQTDDREVVNAYCRQHRIEHAWGTQGPELTTRQTCQAALRHAETGEIVWFNQAHLFHISALNCAEQACLVDTLGRQHVPRNCFYGDGSEIAPATLSHIRAVYARETLTFQWQRGDVMLLDNVLCAHGRNPFSGARKIAVAMG